MNVESEMSLKLARNPPDDKEGMNMFISELKNVRLHLDSSEKDVEHCLKETALLASDGADLLTPEEFSSLARHRDQLRDSFHGTKGKVDASIHRMSSAVDLRSQFDVDAQNLRDWMISTDRSISDVIDSSGDPRRIKHCKDKAKDITDDVVSRSDDLRNLQNRALGVQDELFGYVSEMAGDKDKRRSVDTSQLGISVREAVNDITNDYKALSDRCDQMNNLHSTVEDTSQTYMNILNDTKRKINDLGKEVNDNNDLKGGDAYEVQRELESVREKNNSVMQMMSQIGELATAGGQYTKALERTGQYESTKANIEEDVGLCKQELEKTKEGLLLRANSLQTLLTQSQGVKEGLQDINRWLQDAEDNLHAPKLIPLDGQMLSDQKRKQEVLENDFDSRSSALQSLQDSMKNLMVSSPSAGNKHLSDKLTETQRRFDIVQRKSQSWANGLNDAQAQLDVFNNEAQIFDEWIDASLEKLSSPEFEQEDLGVITNEMNRLREEATSKEPLLNSIRNNAQNLLSIPHATDTNKVREMTRAADIKWKELREALRDKEKDLREKSEQHTVYQDMKSQSYDWLQEMEDAYNKLAAPALDTVILESQMEEVKPMISDHAQFKSVIERANKHGTSYDAVINAKNGKCAEAPDSKRARHDRTGFSPSSTTSSGISSFDNISQLATEDLTSIQKELLNINQRYDLLGRSLLDRQTDIEATSSSLIQYENDRDGLQSWVDGQRDWLRVVQVPLSKKEAEERHVELAKLFDDIKSKRLLYDSLKSAAHELTRLKKPEQVDGLVSLVSKQKGLETDWECLQDECRGAQQRIQESKAFHINHSHMNNWLDSKERMLSVLGPVAADPVSVKNQLQQMQVLQEEITSQEPLYEQLKEEASSLSSIIDKDSEEAEYLKDKITGVNNRWQSLTDGLQKRDKSLQDVQSAGSLFFEQQQQLREWLSPVAEQVEVLSYSNPIGRDQIDHHVAAIESLDAVLESKASELAGLQVACEQLSSLHTDPSVRSDVLQRLNTVKQPFDELKKKLGSLKGAAEMAAAEGEKFDGQLDDLLSWVTQIQNKMQQLAPTSADKTKLVELAQVFHPIYNEVLDREGELSLIKAKGVELQKNGQNDAVSLTIAEKVKELGRKGPELLTAVKNKKSNIDSIEQLEEQWQRSHKDMRDSLQADKDTLDSLIANSNSDINATDSEKRLQQIATFRLCLDSKASDYKSTINVGEHLVSTADADVEPVQDELDQLNALWEALNDASKRLKKDTDRLIKKWGELRHAANDVDSSLQHCNELVNRPDISDPKNIGRLRAALEDLQGPVQKKLQIVEDNASNVATLIDPARSGLDVQHGPSSVNDILSDLKCRCSDLESQLLSKLDSLEGSETLARQLKDEAADLAKKTKALEGGLQEMGSPARDPDHLQSQIRLNEDFMQEIETHEKLLADARQKLTEHENTIGAKETGVISAALDRVGKDLGAITSQAQQRGEKLNELDQTINQLLNDADSVHNQLLDTIAAPILQGGDNAQIGGDIKEVNLHLSDVRQFKDSLEPVSNSVNDVLKRGQALVKSAAPGVETSYLESEVNKLGDAWNELQSRVSDREKHLDMALLGLGNYKDSLNSLQGWLEETEDMVADLPPPSADAKVVKAQLDQQKLVQKLIDDKQPSVHGFSGLSEQMEAMASNDADREHFRLGSDDVSARYDKLATGANDRKGDLLDTLDASEDWSKRLHPFSNWIDSAEKRLQGLTQVPTDEDKLKELIDEHQNLHMDVEEHREDMNGLMESGERLASLVAPKDASDLDANMSNLAARYDRLGTKSQQLATVLEEVSQGVQRFHGDTKQLAIWLDDTQDKLNTFDQLSIYPDELQIQIDDLAMLAEEIADQHPQVMAVVDEGRELCMNTTGDEAVALQGKLDGLKTRYSDLCKKADKAVVNVSEANQLAQTFQESQHQLTEWLNAIETDLSRLDEASLEQQHVLVRNMEEDIQAFKPVIEQMNVCATRLGQLSNEEGGASLDDVCCRLNRRFDGVGEQVQRRGERLSMAKQRSNEIMMEMDDLIGWFREADNRLSTAGAASADPETTLQQLKDQKLMNEDINQQRAKGRELQNACKKLMGDFTGSGEDSQAMQDSVDVLKELSNLCTEMSAERLALLEQALPLAVNLHEDLTQLHEGIGAMESELENSPAVIPGSQPESLRRQQEHNKTLIQSLLVMKPLVEKFGKTAQALAPLCNEEDCAKVQDCAEGILNRYDALKDNVKLRGSALDDALQESSQFSDKLDGMLAALGAAAEQIRAADPVSAVPEQIRGQIEDNCALMDELEQKGAAFQAVKDAASEILSKASPEDPAVKDIDVKMQTLDDLWDELQIGTEERGKSLTDTLGVAERFWDELQTCINAIKQLKKQLDSSAPPACEPQAVQLQQNELEDIKSELDITAEHVDACAAAGRSLLTLVGEENQPEIEQRINELDQSWDTVTSLYHRRFDNLLEALERAMLFHDTLRNLLDWLENAEDRVKNFNPVTSMTLDEIRDQMNGLDGFRGELEDKAVKREQLTQEGIQLVEGTHPDQAVAVRKPLQDLSRRWDGLNGAMNNRHRALEKALLEMGHFEQAYDQLLDWISKSQSTLDDIKPAPGDLRQTEIELAKHKVLQNDVFAHQPSVDTLNDAGRRLMSTAPPGHTPEVTQTKLDTLNEKWMELKKDLEDKLSLLQQAKAEAESFGGNVLKWISWLEEIDAILSSAKPTGGLPETAREQLDAFMEVRAEMEEFRGPLESALSEGKEYLAQADQSKDTSMLGGQVETLKKRWQEAQVKAQDRQKKLEIAMRDAEEFHTRITDFNEWLAHAEQTLNALLPASRLLNPIAQQMTTHKTFQDDVQLHRDLASELQTRGTKLQYYCDKKDAIPIKNLLVSAKHRFDKVVSRTADRTKILDLGFQEAKAFYESYDELCKWMDESQEWLDGQIQQPGNNPDKIKELLARHKDFQHELGKHQPSYDSSMRGGKQLKDHAPKEEEADIQEYVDTLRTKWNALCNGAVDRQRKLEEALLFSGQFNEAVAALIEWLIKVQPTLAKDKFVQGDLDTVQGLVDQHKNLKNELKARNTNVETVRKAAKELTAAGGDTESQLAIAEEMRDLENRWTTVNDLSANMQDKLNEAVSEAEKFHKGAHTLLEWLGDMEMKLKMSGPLPDSESELSVNQEKLKNIMEEFDTRHFELDETLNVGRGIESQCHPDAVEPMKRWMTILQARWDEVNAWATQREQRLEEQMEHLKEHDFSLDQLLSWVTDKEQQLTEAEEAPTPEDLDHVQKLIEEHGHFEEELRGKQGQVDDATKGRRRAEDAPPTIPLKDSKGKKVAQPRKPSKHPKAQQLSDRWRQLWLQSMERQRKLQDLLSYLRELKRLENFSFDDWRSRYMDWMNNKKWRVMDFFRRQDKDGDGRVTRQEFVEGILASSPRRPKFPTTRLEMNKVADIFDKGDGFIDYREFIAALKPDRMPITTEPQTDQARIKNEVVKQVEMCTCPHKYRIREVGEGRYTFGEQAKLRLVRILRSTVMVRVGGGWEALDEFLVKNDPCRAKGRTNIELRERFILAEGVSQTMQSFKSRRSPMASGSHASSSSGSHANSAQKSTPGPITKIREKTIRSVPMHSTPKTKRPIIKKSANDSEVSSILSTTSRRGSNDLLSPCDVHGRSKLPRSRTPASSTSGAGSRPSSRGVDDRPPSRAGSDISEGSVKSRDSLGHTRIPSLRGRKGQRFGGLASRAPFK